MKYVLAGNPNCGKTTLFNRLTKSALPVGNRAGVTVEVTEKQCGTDIFVDLPGVYSLTRPVNEERAAASYINRPDVDYIVNVVDARHLVRNLYLTVQLARIKPTVVLLNFYDVLKKTGRSVDVDQLSDLLGVEVILFSAKKGGDIRHISAAFLRPTRRRRIFPSDPSSLYAELEHIGLLSMPGWDKPRLGDKIDKILLNKYLALPLFLLIMGLSLFLSVCIFGQLLGGLVAKWVSVLSASLGSVLSANAVHPTVISLLCDGIMQGVGSVVSFAPLVCALFFLMALLEDCGYLARVAFLTDRVFAGMGMSGKSVVSYILGCGCTVPAVLSAKTLDDAFERRQVLRSVHFMPCSAKVPLVSLLISALFPKALFALPLIYLFGMICSFLFCVFSRQKPRPFFVMEVPDIKLPSIGFAITDAAVKLRSFLFRTATVVFSASVLVWATSHFNFSLQTVDIEHSILAFFGKILICIFYPIGFTDWTLAVAVLSGFAGKETVVGVLSVLGRGDLTSLLSARTGLVFLFFMLLSSPCAAALVALRKELGKGEFVRCFLFQNAVAFVFCAVLNLVLRLFLP